MNKKICSICRKKYVGFGNNAEPVNNKRCCNECNNAVVIPIRLGIYLKNLHGKNK